MHMEATFSDIPAGGKQVADSSYPVAVYSEAIENMKNAGV